MRTFWERNAPLMGLQYVRRWALVQMNRDQSVADHSFRVWVLARDLFKTLDPIGHNNYDFKAVQLWGLIHDADEYWTSDLPGHFKRAIKELAPGAIDEYVESKFSKIMPEYLSLERGIKGTVVEYIVKICDLLESYIYLQEHGVRPAQVKVVSGYIIERFNAVQTEARDKFKELDWRAFEKWSDEVLGGDVHEDFRLTVGLTPDPRASRNTDDAGPEPG